MQGEFNFNMITVTNFHHMFTVFFADTMLSTVMKHEIVRELFKDCYHEGEVKKKRVYLIKLRRLVDQLRESIKKRKN